jgi:hypothetical protein
LPAVETRRTSDGLLEVTGWLFRPDEPNLPSGVRYVVLVDDADTDPRVVSVTVSERPRKEWPVAQELLDATPDEWLEPVPITARQLREVPIGTIVLEAVWARDADTEGGEYTGRLSNPRKLRAHDDRYFATWAAHYVRLNGSKRAVSELAERFEVDRARVRDTLNTARSRGLLTRGQRGRSGGQLTAKAIDALERKGR